MADKFWQVQSTPSKIIRLYGLGEVYRLVRRRSDIQEYETSTNKMVTGEYPGTKPHIRFLMMIEFCMPQVS